MQTYEVLVSNPHYGKDNREVVTVTVPRLGLVMTAPGNSYTAVKEVAIPFIALMEGLSEDEVRVVARREPQPWRLR